MKRATLQRIKNWDGAMLGILTIEQLSPAPFFSVVTLEASITRLPAGDYMCLPDHTGKFQEWVILGWNASRQDEGTASGFGWFAVEWHIGNLLKHTKACILPGLSFANFPEGVAVADSGDALKAMHGFFGTDPWALRIIDPPGYRIPVASLHGEA